MLRPGDIVERYRIVELLGRGGMGEVYRAHDPRLQRDVALKILGGGDEWTLPPDSEGAARILREARAAAALEHANVVSIYDVGEVTLPGESRATTYLAMELIRGQSLREHVGDPKIGVAQKIKWLSQIAGALDAAHARGLVHRDVKPENVMVREDGVVKVLDFGIAKRARPPLHARSSTAAQIVSTLTGDGVAMGTPLYMSPEQMLGEPLDGRSDQFAWGVVAYELFAGELPWGKDIDALKLVASLLSRDPPPLDEKALGLPRGAAAIVARALAKKPEERFDTMREVIEALGAIDAAAPKPAAAPRPTSDPGSRRIVEVAIASGIIAAASIAVFVAKHGAAPNPAPVPASASAVAPRECATNEDCLRAHDGAFVCRKQDGACVALDAPAAACVARADRGDLESDDTVWIGAMIPASARAHANAIELARRDFAAARAALGRSRAFGVIVCDDAVAPERAVRHLVESVRVPAILGFRNGAELIEHSGELLSRDVLAIATLSDNPLVTSIPQRDGQPRLVWRTTHSATDTANAIGAFVPEVIEKELRSGARPALDASAPLKVALVRPKARSLSPLSEAVFNALRFNGRSALENATNFRELTFDGAADLAQIASALALFAPHVVLVADDEALVPSLIEPLEKSWPRALAYRPRWTMLGPPSPALVAFGASSAERKRRVFGVATAAASAAHARFVAHYDETFDDKFARAQSPSASYDAFYLVAFAAYAIGDEAVTGASLARAFARLRPGLRPIDVGPAGIAGAIAALRRGDDVDIDGAGGKLDLNPATGEASFDQEILCLGAGEALASGLVYDARAKSLRGAMKCPN